MLNVKSSSSPVRRSPSSPLQFPQFRRHHYSSTVSTVSSSLPQFPQSSQFRRHHYSLLTVITCATWHGNKIQILHTLVESHSRGLQLRVSDGNEMLLVVVKSSYSASVLQCLYSHFPCCTKHVPLSLSSSHSSSLSLFLSPSLSLSLSRSLIPQTRLVKSAKSAQWSVSNIYLRSQKLGNKFASNLRIQCTRLKDSKDTSGEKVWLGDWVALNLYEVSQAFVSQSLRISQQPPVISLFRFKPPVYYVWLHSPIYYQTHYSHFSPHFLSPHISLSLSLVHTKVLVEWCLSHLLLDGNVPIGV